LLSLARELENAARSWGKEAEEKASFMVYEICLRKNTGEWVFEGQIGWLEVILPF
jgi:hypothetical protein